MSDIDDVPDLVESSSEDLSDSESPTGAEYAEKWLNKGNNYLEKQELWMRVFSLSPFLFGCSNIISAAWIKALHNAKLLLDENSLRQKTYLSWEEWACLDLVDHVVEMVQKYLRDRRYLASSLECVDRLDDCKNGVVIDVDQAIQEADRVSEITDMWRTVLKSEKTEGKEKATKFAVLYVIRLYREHVVFLFRNSDFIDHTKKMVKKSASATKTAEQYKKHGNECFKQDEFDEAITSYTKAASEDPFNHVYYGNRAQAYIQIKKYMEALADGRRAVVIKPDFPKGHYRYAIAYHELGQLDRAIQVNKSGLQVCRRSPSQDFQNIKDLEAQGLSFQEERNKINKIGGLTSLPKDLGDKLDSYPSPTTDITEKFGCKVPPKNKTQEDDVPSLASSDAESDSSSSVDKKVKGKKRKKAKSVANKSEKKGIEKTESSAATESMKPDSPSSAIRVIEEHVRQKTDKEELVEYLKEAFDSYSKELYKEAMGSYQKALDMLAHNEKSTMFDMDDTDVLTLKYAFSMAAIETKVFKNIMEGIEKLEEIKEYMKTRGDIKFPALYFGLGKAYITMNRFPQAMEPLHDGYQVASHVTYTQVTWPGTKEVIKETNPTMLQCTLKDMLQLCKCPPPPDAVCRYHSDPSDKRTVIYLTDPDFKGYIQIVCQNSCVITFHSVCWKTYKNAQNKVGDKEILDTRCPTPDCVGFIIRIHIIRSDSITEKEYISEKYSEIKEKAKKPAKQEKQKTTSESKIAKKQEKKDKRKQKRRFLMDTDGGKIQTKTEDADEVITDGASAMAFIADIESEAQPTLPDNKDTVVLKKEIPETQKPMKSRKAKKKAKDRTKQILNVEVNFTDRKEETLLNENSVLSDEEKENKKENVMDRPFSVPADLRTEVKNFEKSYSSVSKPSFKHDKITENLFSFFAEILKAHGPLAVDDTRVQQELEVFPQEALEKIKLAGGLDDFLRQSLKFAVIDDVISLMCDAKRAREIALLRRQEKQNSGGDTEVPNVWKTVGKSVNNIDGLSESVKTSVISSAGVNFSSVNSIASSYETKGFMTNSSISNNSNFVSSFGNLNASVPSPTSSQIHWSEGVSTFDLKVPVTLVNPVAGADSLDSIDDFPPTEGRSKLMKTGLDEIDDQDPPSESESEIKESQDSGPVKNSLSARLSVDLTKFDDVSRSSSKSDISDFSSDVASKSLKNGNMYGSIGSKKSETSSIWDKLEGDLGWGKLDAQESGGVEEIKKAGYEFIRNVDQQFVNELAESVVSKLYEGKTVSEQDRAETLKKVSSDIWRDFERCGAPVKSEQSLWANTPAGADYSKDMRKYATDFMKRHYNNSERKSVSPPNVNIVYPQRHSPVTLSPFLNNSTFSSPSPWSDEIRMTPELPVSTQSVSSSSSGYNLFSGPTWGLDSLNTYTSTVSPAPIAPPPRSAVSAPQTLPFVRPPMPSTSYYQHPNIPTQFRPPPFPPRMPLPGYPGMRGPFPPPLAKPSVEMKDKETQCVVHSVTAGTMTDVYEPFKDEYLKMKENRDEALRVMAESRMLYDKLVHEHKAREHEVTVLKADLANKLGMFDLEQKSWKNEKESYVEELKRLQEQLKARESQLKDLMQGQEQRARQQRETDMAEIQKAKEQCEQYRQYMTAQKSRAQTAEIEILKSKLYMSKNVLECFQKEATFHQQRLSAVLQKHEEEKKPVPPMLQQATDFWSAAVKRTDEKNRKLEMEYEAQIEEVRGGKQLSDLERIPNPSPPPIPDAIRSMPFMQQGPMMPRMPFPNRPPFKHPGLPPVPGSGGMATQSAIGAPYVQTSMPNYQRPPGSTSVQYNSTAPPMVTSTPRPLTSLAAASNMNRIGSVPAPRAPLSVPNRPPLKPLSMPGSGTLTSFEKLVIKLKLIYPEKSRSEVSQLIQRLRQRRGGSLSGMTMEDIVKQVTEMIDSSAVATNTSTVAETSTCNGFQPSAYSKPAGPPPGLSGSWAFKNSEETIGEKNGKGSGTELYREEEEDPCVICHEDMNENSAVKLECGHIFHDECIRKWFQEQSTCPNCRVHALLSDDFPTLG